MKRVVFKSCWKKASAASSELCAFCLQLLANARRPRFFQGFGARVDRSRKEDSARVNVESVGLISNYLENIWDLLPDVRVG